MSRTVYLDHNANTLPSSGVIDELVRWSTKGNSSGLYASAQDAKNMIQDFKIAISDQYDFSIHDYTILFTSGASESNAMIIMSACRAFASMKRILPHFVTSSIEHDSINILCKTTEEIDRYQHTKVGVKTSGDDIGQIDLDAFKKAIKSNTCIVSIMHANNETGIILNLKEIVRIAHSKNIPVHTDAVPLVPRHPFSVKDTGIDSFSMSFHKIGAPIGCGILVIKNTLINGYKLPPLIPGNQQYGLRGGTLPIASIASSKYAFMSHYQRRDIKNINLRTLRQRLISNLEKIGDCIYLDDYIKNPTQTDMLTFVLISAKNADMMLSNTLLLSIYLCKNRANNDNALCNMKIRDKLISKNIIISIGSACKTGDAFASHVLKAMNLPPHLYSGVLRISMGDNNTENDIDMFCTTLYGILKEGSCIK